MLITNWFLDNSINKRIAYLSRRTITFCLRVTETRAEAYQRVEEDFSDETSPKDRYSTLFVIAGWIFLIGSFITAVFLVLFTMTRIVGLPTLLYIWVPLFTLSFSSFIFSIYCIVRSYPLFLFSRKPNKLTTTKPKRSYDYLNIDYLAGGLISLILSALIVINVIFKT